MCNVRRDISESQKPIVFSVVFRTISVRNPPSIPRPLVREYRRGFVSVRNRTAVKVYLIDPNVFSPRSVDKARGYSLRHHNNRQARTNYSAL